METLVQIFALFGIAFFMLCRMVVSILSIYLMFYQRKHFNLAIEEGKKEDQDCSKYKFYLLG